MKATRQRPTDRDLASQVEAALAALELTEKLAAIMAEKANKPLQALRSNLMWMMGGLRNNPTRDRQASLHPFSFEALDPTMGNMGWSTTGAEEGTLQIRISKKTRNQQTP